MSARCDRVTARTTAAHSARPTSLAALDVRVTTAGGGVLTWTHGGEVGLIDPSSVDQFHGVIDRVCSMSAADDRAPLALLARCLLIGQAITAALRSRGFSPILLEWPAHSDRLPGLRMRAVASGARAAVVVSDLDTPDHVRDVALLVAPGALPWLVLTESPPSAVWGRLLEEGASGVVPATTTIDGLIQALRDVRAGRSPTPPELRERVIQEWHLVAEQERDLKLRMARLTPREYQVLAMLYDGMSVQQIAESSGVSELTVRSQVSAVRKKLGVDSQLAAVAVFRRALDLLLVGRMDG